MSKKINIIKLKLPKISLLLILVLILFNFQNCQRKKHHIKIAVSKGFASDTNYLYDNWLNNLDTNITIVDLYKLTLDSALKVLDECSGLVLTGGPDVEPSRYGKSEDSNLCEVDSRRDTLEFALIEKYKKDKFPLLAICRGEQILNVAYGGTLITDIPTEKPWGLNHRSDSVVKYHKIKINGNTNLSKIFNLDTFTVNSNHHQAVKQLAKEFKLSAFSTKDSIIEAYEWVSPDGKPYLMAVQWHPEKMAKDNKLSKAIGNAFLNEVKKWHFSKKFIIF